MDCHSANVFKEEEILLSPFLYTAHLNFSVICTVSTLTLSYKKILQVYCLDSVSSGSKIELSIKSITRMLSKTTSTVSIGKWTDRLFINLEIPAALVQSQKEVSLDFTLGKNS